MNLQKKNVDIYNAIIFIKIILNQLKKINWN